MTGPPPPPIRRDGRYVSWELWDAEHRALRDREDAEHRALRDRITTVAADLAAHATAEGGHAKERSNRWFAITLAVLSGVILPLILLAAIALISALHGAP